MIFGVQNILLIIKKKEKMKTEKLSLDAFKAMAKNTHEQEVMNQIEGGTWSDCHGFWGYLGKAFRRNQEENNGETVGFTFEL
jgi:hypothetical protein